VGCPNTLLAAESTSDSTVLDNLSINGLLAKIVHTFLSVVSLYSKVNIKQKISTDNRVFLQSVLNFFMRIRYRIHTVYRIFFLPISTQK